MNLDAARKRHNKPKRRNVEVRASTVLPAEINVTPLVDVVLVLLIIFMVMTPNAEKALAVQLTPEKPAPTAPSHEPSVGQLLVHVFGTGELQLNQKPVAEANLEDMLRKALSERQPAQRVVFVLADDEARYQRLVAVIVSAKRAGAQVVGVVP